MFARRLVVCSVLGTFVLAAASLLSAADDQQPDLQKQLQTLLAERVKTAARGMQANRAAYEAGTVTLDQFIQSGKDLVEAQLAVAKTAPEREAALLDCVQELRQMELKIEKLHKSGSRGGEANAMAMITVARQTAEINLVEEQIRNAAAK